MATTSAPARAGAHLRVDGVSKSYPGRRVLTDVCLVVPAAGRTGLIGENGSGPRCCASSPGSPPPTRAR